MNVRPYKSDDIPFMIKIWNQVVEEGIAFPQENVLNMEEGREFFKSQTHCGVAVSDDGEIVGMYILHPNNVGRCGHICNASYAVDENKRGNHIGESLVKDSIEQGRKYGFGVLQFNAVVATNVYARRLYEKIGFKQLGIIPEGFRMKDGHYEDICPYFYKL